MTAQSTATDQAFLQSCLRLFRYYQSLGNACLQRLSIDQLLWQPHPEVNSVAMLVQHLSGNMRSRFTDWLTTDGEKPWRQRDAEFEPVLTTKQAIVAAWEQGWQTLLTALEALQPGQLSQMVYIRNEGHTVLEALQRQLAHYPYHVGQMVQLARQLLGPEWESLSIPRNSSAAFNAGKFSQPPQQRHFTDSRENPGAQA